MSRNDLKSLGALREEVRQIKLAAKDDPGRAAFNLSLVLANLITHLIERENGRYNGSVCSEDPSRT